jgi:hypothetical protein
MRALPIALLIAILSITVLGQTTPGLAPAPPSVTAPTTASPKPTAPTPAKELPFTKQLRKTVAFIELVCKSGQDTFKVRGTGFFLLYPEKRLGEKMGFTYLVTNRHVAQCWDDDYHPMQVQSISVRVNLTTGSFATVPLKGSGNGNVNWIYPSDESSDLALFPLPFDQNKVDFLPIPVDVLASDDAMRDEIFEGDKIVFSGFFYQFPGERRMQPIIREGILAMMPDAKR